ncbi:hypothetical protein COLO4_14903 [Corchorus olitorius]|uniref:PGG domain-containing protein n=1 Tax=Corchorus olitorius TaxID=93759 RepID=A0A1R3JQD1_9ROSI|nr:hypothetical protein COLO4_14903 [Corchorus olitorius]
MIKLLLQLEEVDRKMLNWRGLTALDVLEQQSQVDNREIVTILCNDKSSGWFIFKVSRFHTKLTTYFKEMKLETINALLVVFALVLAMTYQAVLSPPGGFLQGDSGSITNDHVGKSVMNSVRFLLFYVPNGIAVLMAWITTISLLNVVAKSIMPFLFPLYLLMCFCYVAALNTIAPTRYTVWVAGFVPCIFVFVIYYVALYRFKKQ